MGALALAAAVACSDGAPSGLNAPTTETTSEALTLPAGFIEENLGGFWNEAVGLTFAEDGRLFVWEKAGRVWEVDADGTRHAQPLIDISAEVGNWSDHGLLGFALHPNFLSNGYIYLFYVVDRHHLKNFGTAAYSPTTDDYNKDTISRITRYQAQSSTNFTTVDLASRTVLLGTTPSDGCRILFNSHGVGSLAFGSDGTLLATCGDSANFFLADGGGETLSNTAIADGIITQKENVGSFRAQLLDSLAGKLLRIDAITGDGVPSNPFYDASAPRSGRSRTWALGLRNPFRMSLRPETGTHDPADGDPGSVYIGNVGWNAWEELDVARTGGENFGWPLFEGLDAQGQYQALNALNRDAPNPLFGQPGCTQQFFPFKALLVQETLNTPSYPNPCAPSQQVPSGITVFERTRPVLDWSHTGNQMRVPTFDASGNATAALIGTSGAPPGTPTSGTSVTGGVWYTADDFPAQYKNTYFVADYVAGWIKSLVFDAADRLVEVRPFAPSQAASLVALATSPAGGGLYYVAYGSSVRRIRVAAGGNRPPTALAAADLEYGPSPLQVQFTGSESRDPELGPLTYSWNFGDGSTPSTAADPVHTFDPGDGSPRAYDVVLTVKDSALATASASVKVVVNDTPPSVSILSPTNGGVFPLTGPTLITLEAEGDDEETPIESLECEWQTLLHHNAHSHLEATLAECGGEALVAPVSCSDDTYFYEFKLKLSDGIGLEASQSTILYPDCTPAPLSPSGGGISEHPTYTWRRVLGADQYRVVVDDSSGAGRIDQTFAAASAGCADGSPVCAVTPATALSLGAASFKVQAHNPVDGWRGWSGSLSFEVEGNDPPVASAGADQTVVSGALVVLDGNASSDGNGDPLSYAWTQVGGPAVTLTNATLASATFVAPTVATTTTLQFTLEVSDAAHSDADTVEVTVQPAGGVGTGLTGDYFSGTAFNTLFSSRVDATVNFDWGYEAPIPGMGADNFSVRWTGELLAPATGEYQFATESDDGVRLWVKNQLVLENWTNHGPTTDTGTITLQAGVKYAFRMEFYDSGYGALARLRWLPPGGTPAPIPQANLFPVPVAEPEPEPPIADAGSDRSITSGVPVTLDGSDSSDGNGDTLAFAWTQISGPVVTLSQATTATPSFVTPTVSAPTPLEFMLEVSDATESDSDTVVITVLPPGTEGTGLKGEYFNGTAFNTFVGQRIDPVVDFSWGVPMPGVTGGNFSVRWTGSVRAPTTGSYQFSTVSDDGVRLWVNDQAVVNNWTNHGPTTNTGTITLQAGVRYALRMEFYEAGWGATARLSWQPPGGTTAVIPQTALFPDLAPPEPEPPVADAGADRSVTSGAAVTLDGTHSSDENGDALSFAWTQISGPVVTLSGATTATPSFVAPAVSVATTLEFSLAVSDATASDSDSVVITVQPPPPPVPPDANAGSDRSVNSGVSVVLNGTGSSDANGDPLTYAWTQIAGPGVALSGATSASASFLAPAVTASTTLEFRLVVSDATASDSDTVVITVLPPPTEGSGLKGEYFNGTSFNTFVAQRIDSVVDFSWGVPMPGVTGGNFSVRWTGSVRAPTTGSYQFSTVSDDGVRLWVNDQLLINNWTPHSPTTNTGTITLQAGVRYALRMEFYEAGWGATARLSWQPPGGSTVVIPQIALFPDLAPPEPEPPVADAGADRSVTSGATVVLDGTESSDENGDALSYVWTQIAGPAVALTGATTASASFVAPALTEATTLEFLLEVSDATESDSDTVVITVQPPPPPVPPVANAGSDRSVNSAATVVLNGTGSSDANGDPLTYTWTQIAGPLVTLSGATLASASFVAPTVSSSTTLEFLLEVSDASASDTDSVVITVQPPVTTGTGLTGAYYNGTAFNTFVAERIDPVVDFSWGVPMPGVTGGNFSVRWTGSVLAPASGTYQFATDSDDGVRLWVNNQLLIDNWTNHAPTTNSGTITLQAGTKYPIKMEFYEGGWGATARLRWLPPGGTAAVIPQVNLFPAEVLPPPPQPPVAEAGADRTVNGGVTVLLNGSGSSDPNGDPLTYAWTQISGPAVTLSGAATATATFLAPSVAETTTLEFLLQVNDATANDTDTIAITVLPPGSIGTGLRGQYYNGTALGTFVGERVDPVVDFSWGVPMPGVTGGNFSVRWTGQVLAPATGSYQFLTDSDDGVRLWVNDQALVNNWTNHSPTTNSGTITLQAGVKYAIRMEFYEAGWGAIARLRWVPPGGAAEVIPQVNLFTP